MSKNEEIRVAIVRLVNKKGTFTRLRRSIQHLYPIEVTSEHKSDKLDNSIDVPETEIPQVRIRPRRVAAMNTDLIRQLVDQSTD